MDNSDIAKFLISLSRDLVPHDKKIGVVVSGGFDSSVLYWLIKEVCNHRGQECIPFTVPWVPTGIKTGVSIEPWLVFIKQALAFEDLSEYCKLKVGFI